MDRGRRVLGRGAGVHVRAVRGRGRLAKLDQLYEYAFGRPPSAPPRLFERNPTETLVLYGLEDAVVPAAFVDCMAVAFLNVVGPFGVTGAGHFLQWEQAALFNRTLQWFCRDLLVSR